MSVIKFILLFVLSLFMTNILLGCAASFSQKPSAKSAEKNTANNQPHPAVHEKIRKTIVQPNQELSKELLYELLLAEFALQRSNYQLAYDKYYNAAKKTGDSRLAKKATRVSLFAKNEAQTFKAVKLWSELEPDNIDVQQILASTLIKKRQDEKAIIYLHKIISLSSDFEDGISRVINILDTIKEQDRVIRIFTQISEPHKEKIVIKLYWAKISLKYGDFKNTEKYLHEILAAKPDYLKALIVQVELLKKQKKNHQAIQALEKIIQNYPENKVLRLELIRLLVENKSYKKGFEQVQILADSELAPEVLFTISLLSIEMDQLDAAKQYLERLYTYKLYANEAAYFIAQLEAERKDYAQAEQWFKKVKHGKYTFEAYLGLVVAYSQQQKFEQAFKLLEHSNTNSNKQSIDVLQIKAEVYSQAKKYKKAYEIYTEALDLAPDNSDLRYGRAMLAEKFDRIDLLEQDLLIIIKANPQDNQALNALGYTLTEKTNRYQEAYQYIEQALEINPEDVATLDSMGWILHKLGKNKEAVKYLRKAYDKDPDPEIAAHLGEVLWSLGQTNEAKSIWLQALKKDPEHQVLLSTTTRYLK
ncbi:MAG: tetratricopeptide repeat protein [gamma proteobacterium symbiont of Taylorina sp.]|nr:tetratricopeptide repeat protein [gamma proteobacterium symbiont of Taylorina sp.]